MPPTTIVKRKGRAEPFDEKKVYGSVYAACTSAFYAESKCEKTAAGITRKIKQFVAKKKKIRSANIRKKVSVELKKKDKQLAFFYEHYLPNLKRL